MRSLILIFLVVIPLHAFALNRYTEKGELVPIGCAKSECWVPDRVVCHTFAPIAELPYDQEVPVSDLTRQGNRFIDLLAELGVHSVRYMFNGITLAYIEKHNSQVEHAEGFDEELMIDLSTSYVLTVERGASIAGIVEKLRANEHVLDVDYDYLIPAGRNGTFADPKLSDPLWQNQWNLHAEDDIDDFGIGCPTAWSSIGVGSPSVRVGILERGIDPTHPDFCFGIVPYIVDGLVSVTDPIGGEPYWSDDPADWADWSNSHGISVAGIIGSRSGNGCGIHGIAGGDGGGVGCEGVSLVSLNFIRSGLVLPFSGIAELVALGADPIGCGGKGCDVISTSTGFPVYDEGYRKAVIHAYEQNCSFISGKGESSEGHSAAFVIPGDYDYSMVTCVSGYSDSGYLCEGDCGNYFTDYGYGLDLLAPADLFPAPVGYHGYGQFLAVSGAIPHVAGSVALLRSYFEGSSYFFRPEDYEWMLKLSAWMPSSGIGSGDNRIWHEEYGHGCLRVGDAAECLSQQDLQIKTYSSNGGVVVDSLFTAPELYHFGSKAIKGEYLAQVFRVSIPVLYSDTFAASPIPRAWGVCCGCLGISAANPNYSKPYCVVEDGSQGVAGCVLNTYVMRLHNKDTGVFERWYPCLPGQAVATCRVVGVIAPIKMPQGASSDVDSAVSGNILYMPKCNEGTEIYWQATPYAPTRIKIFDIRGRMVHEASDLQVKSTEGRFLWKGETTKGRAAPAGVYIVSVESAESKSRGKIILMR